MFLTIFKNTETPVPYLSIGESGILINIKEVTKVLKDNGYPNAYHDEQTIFLGVTIRKYENDKLISEEDLQIDGCCLEDEESVLVEVENIQSFILPEDIFQKCSNIK